MFTQESFGPISSHGNSNMPNIWTYRTNDDVSDVLLSGYFNEKLPLINDGDYLQADIQGRELFAIMRISEGSVQLSPIAGGAASVMEVMRWTSDYAAGTLYKPGDVSRSGDWTRVALVDTYDDPAPYPVGNATTDLPNTPAFLEQTNQSVIYSGHLYDFVQAGWIKRLDIWIDEVTVDTNYRIVIANITNPESPLITTIEEPVINPGQWTTIRALNRIAVPGDKLLIYIDGLNGGGSTAVNGGWTRSANDNSLPPPAQGWNHNTQNTLLRIDKTDLDNVARGTELLSIDVNSTVQFIDSLDADKSITYRVTQAPVDQTTYVEYTVSVISVGPLGEPDVNEASTMSAEIPVPQPTKYAELGSNWPANNPSWADVTGYLAFDGVDQSAPASAFGIRLEFQPGEASADWDTLSTIGDGSGSSSAGGDTLHFGAFTIDTIPLSQDPDNPTYLTGVALFGTSSPDFSVITAPDSSLLVKNNSSRTFSMQGTATYQTTQGAGGAGNMKLWSERSTDDGVTFTENPFSLRTSEVPNNSENSQTKSSGVDQWAPGESIRWAMYNSGAGAVTLDGPTDTVNGGNVVDGLTFYWQLNEV